MAKIQRENIFPFLTWFPMNVLTLRADHIAGVTVGLLIIPQSMAYAELAGLPVYYGLYAAFVPVILGAMFGSLPQLATGPVAMTSLLTASVLVRYADPDLETAKYVQMAILLAFMVGLMKLLVGVCRMTFLLNFISSPVVSGFTNAGAMIIAMSQINKILGIPSERSQGTFGFLKSVYLILLHMNEVHMITLLFGIGSMGGIYLLKKFHPRLPSMLIIVILSIIMSASVGFERMGGLVVGAIPQGLPRFGWLEWSWDGAEQVNMLRVTLRMFPDAILITLFGLIEVLAISKVISMKTKQPFDLNQELIGQGLASIGGSFAQSYPTSASFARSAMNLMAGAKTGLSSVVTGFVVMVILLGFTQYLYYLPKATLAAGVIMAVISLIDFRPLKHAWRANTSDGISAIVTLFATLCFAPDMSKGILLGAALALLLYLYRTMKPQVAILGRHQDGTLKDAAMFKLKHSENIIAIRFNGSLYFACTTHFEESIVHALAKYPKARYVLVVAEGMNRIDASGEWALRQLLDRLRENDITLVVAAMRQRPMQILERTGLVQEIGKENFFPSADAAITEIYRRLEQSGQQPAYRLL